MILHFDYNMEIFYSEPVNMCHFTIKCIPRDDARQRLIDSEITTLPQTVYSSGEDSHGNRQIYGSIGEPHDYFCFHTCGRVEITEADFEEEARAERVGLYRYPHGKCVPGDGILQYYKTLDLGGCASDYDKCIHICHRLHEDFTYSKAKTNVMTNAEEAWKIGAGVCQDYSHIYITLLRLAGIPARYVCGLLIGEGESHAWVEALCDGKWVGFDPTNDCLVHDSHIKLGDGRDATECAINRGIMIGGGTQTQRITAAVEKEGT